MDKNDNLAVLMGGSIIFSSGGKGSIDLQPTRIEKSIQKRGYTIFLLGNLDFIFISKIIQK